MKPKCIVPLSGGLDSTVIYHAAISQGLDVHAVGYDYGQKHASKELSCARELVRTTTGDELKVIELSFFKDIVTTSALTNNSIAVAKARDVVGDPQTVNYVPNRNMMMLSICTAYAESIEATKVFHGAALVDSQAGFWDGSKEFLSAINAVNQLNRRTRIEIIAPLILKSKADIISMGVNLQVDFSKTWTCYEGAELACGECTACSSRIKGFVDAGQADPIAYNIDIPWEKLITV
jgi:7-cyano-7-deazaguanine synthase